MVSRRRQHVHYPRTCALLTKLHLEYRVVYGLPGNLSPEQVQFAMRNFELRSRVFVLQNSSKRHRGLSGGKSYRCRFRLFRPFEYVGDFPFGYLTRRRSNRIEYTGLTLCGCFFLRRFYLFL